MAQVTANIARADQVHVIDARQLMDGESPPPVNAEGAPSMLRGYIVSKDPSMMVIPHFFSDAECDHLLELVDSYWIPSLVGQATYSTDEDYSSGNLQNALSTTRTSWSCMLRSAQTSIVERLEHRLASMSGLPLSQLERMNMVRYAPGELFDEHHDGKFRPKTIFVYLNDLPEDDEEGDTFFPVLGLSLRPRRGTAVMWSNIVPGEDREDSRMLHAGRPPRKSVKYGVNCFFNVNDMRHTMEVGPDLPIEESVEVRVANLNQGRQRAPGEVVTAFCLCKDPKLVAVPGFLSASEIAHLLELAEDAQNVRGMTGAKVAFKGATEGIYTLKAGQTEIVEEVESRVAATGGLSMSHLAPLRVVRPGSRRGFVNRGCGPKSAYVCLSEQDEVYFPKVGLRLLLRSGDALFWPNVDWETGTAVEDVRTVRVHLGGGAHDGGACGSAGAPSPVIGLDAFFQDNPIREQQELRRFVHDSEVIEKHCDVLKAAVAG